MAIENLAELAAALNRTETDSLASVPDEACAHAREHGIRVVPVRVGCDLVIELDDQLGTREVVDLAAASGAKLLYLQRHLVDASRASVHARILDLPDSDEAARQSVLDGLAKVDGWISRVSISFAHEGVQHSWTASAAWADEIDMLSHQQRNPHWLTEIDINNPNDNTLSDEDITKLAQELVAQPEFRKATRVSALEAAARKMPALAFAEQRSGWEFRRVVAQARLLLRDQIEHCLDQLQNRRGELAGSLAADSEFRSIRTAGAREKFAHEWMLAHSDQLRLPTWWIKEFLADVKAAKPRASS